MEPGFDLVHHPLDMAVGFYPDHFTVTLPRITPVEDFDGHTAYAPFIHESPRRLVEVDGISSGKSKAVVIDLEDLTRGPDPKYGAAWPPGPVCGGTVNDAVTEWGA